MIYYEVTLFIVNISKISTNCLSTYYYYMLYINKITLKAPYPPVRLNILSMYCNLLTATDQGMYSVSFHKYAYKLIAVL